MNTGVYIIKNSVNGKVYIGSSGNIKNRFSTHKSNFKHNRHQNKRMQIEYNKHGDIFSYRVMLWCSKENLLFYEQRTMDAYKEVMKYNIHPAIGKPKAVLIFNVKDKIKEKFIEKTTANNETMSEVIREYINKYLSKK